jgi:polyhydroxybutyrate depolymerase
VISRRRHCAENTEVILLRIDNGGHTWPGGKQYLPERMIGKVCRDIDAGHEIFEFFSRHDTIAAP